MRLHVGRTAGSAAFGLRAGLPVAAAASGKPASMMPTRSKRPSPSPSRRKASCRSPRLGRRSCKIWASKTQDGRFEYRTFGEFIANLRAAVAVQFRYFWGLWGCRTHAFYLRPASLHGLSVDQEHEALCAVLRSTIGAFTISQTWSMSLAAVHAASMLVAKGSSQEDASASLPGHIDRQCKAHYFDLPVPGPMPRPPAQPCANPEDEFHKWFGGR